MSVVPDGPREGEVDFDTAVAEPRNFYANPEAIVADPTLDAEQKRRFLTEWRRSLAEPPAAGSLHVADDAEAMIARVDAALAAAGTNTAPPSQGRRWWTPNAGA